jgi:hypothetical protein
MPFESKLTQDLQDKVATLVSRAVPVETAVKVARISTTTFYRWLNEGEALARANREGPQLDFLIAITHAREACEARLAEKWDKIVNEGISKRTQVYREEVVTHEDGTVQLVKVLDKETVETTGDGDWRGIAELLSRRYPDRWRRSQGVEVSGPDGGPIEVVPLDLDRLSLATKRALLAELESGETIDAEVVTLVAPMPIPSWSVGARGRNTPTNPPDRPVSGQPGGG